MIVKEKHTSPQGNRKTNSLIKSILVLGLAVLFFPQNRLLAQVISNTGAAISLSQEWSLTVKIF